MPERTYFQDDDITVTSARFIKGTRVYPISSILSVDVFVHEQKVHEQEASKWYYGVALGFGILGIGIVAPSPLLVVGPLVALVSLLIAGFEPGSVVKKITHTIRLKGNAETSVVFSDETLSDAFSSAIHQAMIDAVSGTSSGATVAQELAELAALRDAGILDSADWDRARDMFLGKRPDAQRAIAEELRQLHELFKSGVLTESEFNLKKWDVLARTS